ncbi:hypothetical protein ACGFNU_49410 [Spirillospora sp. NPDC048911]|uniref:hypothetical protein n=1 Tax=Spirillospora sp. NPDC048911 TaxID=3364527 RepID=UPI003717714E
MGAGDDGGRERLAEVERTLDVLRREVGPPTDEPKDYGDAAAEMSSREEQAALIESLEIERDHLRRQLDLE